MSYEQAVAALQAGRWQEAEALLRTLAASATPHPDALQLLGLTLCRQGRLEEGVRALDEAIAKRPDHAAAHFNRAQAYAGLGQLAAARADLERALAIKPELEVAWIALGGVLAQLQDAPGAERAYRRAITLRDGNANAHYNLGLLCQEQGRFDEAIAC